MLAIYGLGASPEIIEEAYSRDLSLHDYLKPAFDSPEPITEKNFAEHLGNGRCAIGCSFRLSPNNAQP